MSQLISGLIFPNETIHQHWYLVLATIVALNTTIYAALSIGRVLPKWLDFSKIRGKRQRAETRSIYPDSPV
jgi:hypothetical protein